MESSVPSCHLQFQKSVWTLHCVTTLSCWQTPYKKKFTICSHSPINEGKEMYHKSILTMTERDKNQGQWDKWRDRAGYGGGQHWVETRATWMAIETEAKAERRGQPSMGWTSQLWIAPSCSKSGRSWEDTMTKFSNKGGDRILGEEGAQEHQQD